MTGAAFRCLRITRRSREKSRIALCRAYSSTVSQDNQLGPIQQNGHQSFRTRKDGKALPLPPSLDPVVEKARWQWKQPKKQPDVNSFTPFQQKLWENPYAFALASPVRQCKATNMLFPREFLASLHARPHPETGDPWLLPIKYTTKERRLGVPYHFLGRYVVAKALSQGSEWRKGVYFRLSSVVKRSGGQLTWREDTAEMILSLMREKLLHHLRWHFKGNGKLVACVSPRIEDLEHIDDVSCVLFLGSLKTRADEIQQRAEELDQINSGLAQAIVKIARQYLDPHKSMKAKHPPPFWWKGPVVPSLKPRARFPELEFSTTSWRGSRVPVYSLVNLLGEDIVKELLTGSRFENERCLVLKSAKHNTPLAWRLLHLQAYLARSRP